MNGADLLVRTAIRMGVEVCFANAGTTEMPIVVALDSTPGIKAYLGLFEGVCTGAADGYGRMLGKPAMTLLHLGPGFANGIGNLHNARRARSPVLNVVGEHATWHRPTDPPLAMEIETLAKTVSGWWRTNTLAQDIAHDVACAVAVTQLGQVATLIVPHDHQLAVCHDRSIHPQSAVLDLPDLKSIEAVALRLTKPGKSALLLGGRGLRKSGLAVAARVKRAIGCDLLAPRLPAYIERGAGHPRVERIPYFPEDATSMLSRYDVVVLAGVPEPVTFFGYPGVRSQILAEGQEKLVLCTETQNVVGALESLADCLGAPARLTHDKDLFPEPNRPPLSHGELTAEKACQTLAALQPEGAIIVDEAVTSATSYFSLTEGLSPHSLMTASGGSLGYGIPCATGAAIACPGRPVITLQADGSALYTAQALWTQAHEGLDITTLICSNRSYRILQMELHRARVSPLGPNTLALTEMKDPPIDWVKIAEGFGIPGVTVSTAEALARELARALAEPGPHLIEMLLP